MPKMTRARKDHIGARLASMAACLDSMLHPSNIEDITEDDFDRLGDIYNELLTVTNEVNGTTRRRR